jgi:hypothetical protein
LRVNLWHCHRYRCQSALSFLLGRYLNWHLWHWRWQRWQREWQWNWERYRFFLRLLLRLCYRLNLWQSRYPRRQVRDPLWFGTLRFDERQYFWVSWLAAGREAN